MITLALALAAGAAGGVIVGRRLKTGAIRSSVAFATELVRVLAPADIAAHFHDCAVARTGGCQLCRLRRESSNGLPPADEVGGAAAQRGRNVLIAATRMRRWHVRREYPELISQMRQHLVRIRDAVAAAPSLALPSSDIGCKVWLLPPWYAQRLPSRASALREWCDLSARHLSRPTLICAGELRIDGVRSTGRPWAVGKGLIGMATSPMTHEAFDSVVHDEELGSLARMSRSEYRRQPQELKKGRKRRDVRALWGTYGSAVAVGLRTSPEAMPFGRVTTEVPSGRVLKKEQIEACADILVTSVPSEHRRTDRGVG